MQLFIKCGTRYKPASPAIIKDTAARYLDDVIIDTSFTSPTQVIEFLKQRFQLLEREHFGVLFLDSRHRVIDFNMMFQGTIDASAVYPREVVKHALSVNASACIFAHNHPSGHASPSDSDKQITMALKDALSMVDVRVLDHFVIGRECHTSFAECGYL